jgi:hypothetical protein
MGFLFGEYSIDLGTMKKIESFLQLIGLPGTPHDVTFRLEALKGLRERPDFHPEESAFEHIRIVTDRLIETEDPDLILAGCLHDLFKHDTVRINPKNGFPTCPGHDSAVASFIRREKEIQEWIESFGADFETVAALCKDHMRFHQFGQMRRSKQEEFMSRPHWKKLEVLGAADNMLEEFDLNNLEKSWKWKRKG